MTAKITPILAAAALAALACTGTPTPSFEQAAATTLGSERVLLAPLNLALRVPAELQDVDEPVWH